MWFPGCKTALKYGWGRGSAPDPADGAYNALADPAAELKGPNSKGGEGRKEGEKFPQTKTYHYITGRMLAAPAAATWVSPVNNHRD